ncbi:hypothetical protein [Halopiger xanaduensis]|uniref:Uncharacterized protein n=1 Tax=Halopiger xanaduensis (strain DSM 18323 / JCM 14033 / SH-6) TaxID=797210 RepID=F8DA90_HALXS|nr:hypothetical protein [Halopiger xanaduensis]AEH38162.1 hypothetical protein Halxa_3551 [Halopiger xanaduensis SH-6]
MATPQTDDDSGSDDEEPDRNRGPTLEATYDHISLYVYEAGTNELLETVYEADTLAIPAVGDRLSFTEAHAEGNLENRAVSYQEEREPPTYVVEEREVTYLHVDYDIDGVDEDRQLVSEVRVWVSEAESSERAE